MIGDLPEARPTGGWLASWSRAFGARAWRRRTLLLAMLGSMVVWSGHELSWTGTRDWRDATGVSGLPGGRLPMLQPSSAGEPELLWLGHAGFLVRWADATVLVDPNLSAWCKVARRTWSAEPAAETLRTVGPVDAVLVSHAHFDHLDLPTLRSLETPGIVALPTGAGKYVEGHVRARVLEVEPSLDSRRPAFEVAGVEVFAVPAAHNGNRFHPLASREKAVGYVLRRGGEAVYFAGDTGPTAPFEEIAQRFSPSLAILPIGAYLPAWPLQRYHLSPRTATAAADKLGARTVVPSHFGTFRLSLDRPSTALGRFARLASDAGIEWALAPPAGGSGP